jgi:signal transduction histidine kinase
VQLQQVLLNVIINACDAMKDTPPANRVVHISTSSRNGAVRLSLHDQGCGIPDGDFTRIFQSFYTTKPEGMGIGLSICRSIIAAHHGNLWAEPDKDSGTTFHIELQSTESFAA